MRLSRIRTVVLIAVIIAITLTVMELRRVLPSGADTELAVAVVDGNFDRCERLLASGANPNKRVKLYDDDDPAGKVGPHRAPALVWAASKQKADIVRLLLKRGADVNGTDDYGMTALMHAGSQPIAEALLQAGAAVNAQDAIGSTALMNASDTGVIKTLLAHGADLHLRNRRGETALTDLAQRADEEALKIVKQYRP
jgi:hypothetical protein